ncbi:protein phosphatase 1 regulatory subunit 12A-like isoform X1 [Pleurodeles waltl]|uniref:protein phosphatase 1 regulatory subunit 12A-like isoform X1 n=1 Tax=Pleurodeles waltl TaxID=8319 RepID=UPI00370990B7
MAAADDRSRSDAAKLKRREQLSRWRASEEEAAGGGQARGSAGRAPRSRVSFAQGAVFMAACSAGDRAEVKELLAAGAPINGTNVDGLTALHQACIDENVDMVHFLVENGAYVNQPDNEGWTPLHAAASCGFVEIAEYLLKHGANIASVNSEGELPLDVAHENAMEKLLKAEIKNQGIDLETARQEEEQQMLRDARQWVNKGKVEDVRHPKTGATALHVAAAKGYMEVMKLLLQVGYDVDATDADGWTPLHAAAHWGQQEACRLLVEDLCNMEAVNTVGQTPLDVADDSLVSLLEELKKKQSELRLVKEKKKPPTLLIESSTSPTNPAGRARSKEKISLHDKERRTEPATLERLNDEEEEPTKKESSSSSSEEEEASESESEAESEKMKTRERVNNLNNKLSSLSLTAVTPSTTTSITTPTTTSTAKKAQVSKEEEKSGPAPGAWRTTLRKTGSYGALNTATTQPEEPKNKDAVLPKSASSPRLASELTDMRGKEVTEPRLARVPPTPTRRLFGNQESIQETTNRDSLTQVARSGSYTRQRQGSESTDIGLNRAGSQARRFGESDGGKKEPSQPQPADSTVSSSSYQRSSSFGRKTEVPVSTSSATSISSSVPTTQTASTAGTSSSRVTGRFQSTEDNKQKNAEPTTLTNPETKERRRSYLTPVRDEEAEAQRKARSRHARQSRRSTQGVTLTDLKEAEKTIKAQQGDKPADSKETEAETQEKADESKDNQSKSKTGRVSEEGPSASEVSWRSRIASLQKSDLLGLTSPSDPPRTTAPGGPSNYNRQGTIQTPASKELEKSKEEEKDLDDRGSRNRLGVRDRRRPRGKRRSTGVPLTTRDSDDDGSEDDDDGNEESEGKQVDGLSSRGESVSNDHLSGRVARNPRTPSSIAALLGPKEPEKKDFKQLYEDLMKDNGRIRLQLQEMQSLVTQTKVELEKANQRQERTVDRSVLLDTEKREKAILERRISELQEELKVLADLKADNQRLKDENGALIRVISKLSK